MASVIGLASMRRKAEAALLRPLTEEFLLTGAADPKSITEFGP